MVKNVWNKCVNEWTNEDEQINEEIKHENKWTNEWIDDWINKWKSKQTKKQRKIQSNEQIKENIPQKSYPQLRHHHLEWPMGHFQTYKPTITMCSNTTNTTYNSSLIFQHFTWSGGLSQLFLHVYWSTLLQRFS